MEACVSSGNSISRLPGAETFSSTSASFQSLKHSKDPPTCPRTFTHTVSSSRTLILQHLLAY